MKNLWVLPGVVYMLLSCSSADHSLTYRDVSEDFKNYWYAGVAELNRYELHQARYGEIHKGDAVLIFVSEDFLQDKQVKYEGRPTDEEIVSVLKLNFTRKFNTGIYPYSMMSSIFTPISTIAPTFKTTTTSQEWCGHTFSQLNYRDGSYEGILSSYFESEADQQFTLGKTLLEDELWNLIRLEPEQLPIGNIQLILGSQFLRMKHIPTRIENANATLESIVDEAFGNISSYRVVYQNIDRALEIKFEQDFPHGIVAWSESSDDLTTIATLTHQLNSPYWSQNNVADSVYRQQLGLE
ncbi:MAG: hypothetical protein JXQ90_01410 [Cyclobacteriaceae bacterium]